MKLESGDLIEFSDHISGIYRANRAKVISRCLDSPDVYRVHIYEAKETYDNVFSSTDIEYYLYIENWKTIKNIFPKPLTPLSKTINDIYLKEINTQ